MGVRRKRWEEEGIKGENALTRGKIDYGSGGDFGRIGIATFGGGGG